MHDLILNDLPLKEWESSSKQRSMSSHYINHINDITVSSILIIIFNMCDNTC